MKIAIITDTHFGIKNDAKYILDYQEKFYQEIFYPYLKENNIKTIFHLGDLFDRRKYINFATLKRTKDMFFEPMKREQIKCYLIPGNHDVYHKNTNEINSLQQVLGEYNDFVELLMEPTTLTWDDDKPDGATFSFVPWINQTNSDDTMKWLSNQPSYSIVCAHLELAGFEMYAGIKNEHGMSADLFNRFKQVWSGHFHHKSDKGNIRYFGAPMEFTFADADDPRGFHVYDTKTKKLTYHQNPFKMYEKIYYNDESEAQQEFYRNTDTSVYANKAIKLYVVRKTKPSLFEYFIEKLFNEEDVKMVIHEDYSEFHEDAVDLEEIKDQSTKDLMESYIDGVETDMNKPKLKNILNSIYMEALNTGSVGQI